MLIGNHIVSFNGGANPEDPTMKKMSRDKNGKITHVHSASSFPQVKKPQLQKVHTNKGEVLRLNPETHSIHTEEEEKVKETLGDQVSYFWSLDTDNYETLFGAAAGYSLQTAQVEQIRVISAGMRFLPSIEFVTDSSTLAISRYYACTVTPSSLNQVAQHGKDLFQVMRSCPDFLEETNSRGVSSRLGAHQEGVIQMTQYQALANIDSNTLSTTNLLFPCMVAVLTEPVELTIDNYMTFPVRLTMRCMFEAIVKQPSPFLCEIPGYDPELRESIVSMEFDPINYPKTSAGHTFKPLKALPKKWRKPVESIAKQAYKAGLNEAMKNKQFKQGYRTVVPIVRKVIRYANRRRSNRNNPRFKKKNGQPRKEKTQGAIKGSYRKKLSEANSVAPDAAVILKMVEPKTRKEYIKKNN
jgi:hypothetical protein